MKLNANFLKFKRAPAKVKVEDSAAAGMKVNANQPNEPTSTSASASAIELLTSEEDSAAADENKTKTMDEMFQDLALLRKTLEEKELELEKWEHPDGWFSKDVEKSRYWITKKADNMQQIKYGKTMLKCYKKLSMDLYE